MSTSSLNGAGVVGCVTFLGLLAAATVGLVTGHLSSGDWQTVALTGVGVTGLVGTAHVVGTQVNTAASAAPTPQPTPVSVDTQPIPVTPPVS